MITLLAADQARALAFPAGAVIGKSDLQRRIHRFGTGIGEEHVIEMIRRDLDQAFGQSERQRMRHLEGRREIKRRDLLLHGFDDAWAGVAGVAAPQPAGAVEDLAAVYGAIEHARGTGHQPWRGFELAIGRERHPESIHRIRLACGLPGVMVGKTGGRISSVIVAHGQAPSRQRWKTQA